MIRIMIKWDFVSPLLKTVSGIVEVHNSSTVDEWELLSKFKATCKPGSLSYESINDGKGMPSVVLDSIKPQLDVMMRSFRDGVVLNKSTFSWIHDDEQEEAKAALRKINEEIDNPEFKDECYIVTKSDTGECYENKCEGN